TACSTVARLMSQMATRAPSLANFRAVASPMPWPAPVMIETFPERRILSFPCPLSGARAPPKGAQKRGLNGLNIAVLDAMHKLKLQFCYSLPAGCYIIVFHYKS